MLARSMAALGQVDPEPLNTKDIQHRLEVLAQHHQAEFTIDRFAATYEKVTPAAPRRHHRLLAIQAHLVTASHGDSRHCSWTGTIMNTGKYLRSLFGHLALIAVTRGG